MEITLPGPSEVRFVAAVRNAMRVRVTQADGLLARVGFRDGDVVIGADGRLFENQMQAGAALIRATSRADVKFIVLRGRARLEFVADLRELQKKEGEDALGGDLDPVARPE
jgi:hypothetical protein